MELLHSMLYHVTIYCLVLNRGGVCAPVGEERDSEVPWRGRPCDNGWTWDRSGPFQVGFTREDCSGKKWWDFYLSDSVPHLTSFHNSDVTHPLLVFLPFSQRPVLRLSLCVQRLLLRFGVGGDDEGGTPDSLHCLLTRPGQKHTFILNINIYCVYYINIFWHTKTY